MHPRCEQLVPQTIQRRRHWLRMQRLPLPLHQTNCGTTHKGQCEQPITFKNICGIMHAPLHIQHIRNLSKRQPRMTVMGMGWVALPFQSVKTSKTHSAKFNNQLFRPIFWFYFQLSPVLIEKQHGGAVFLLVLYVLLHIPNTFWNMGWWINPQCPSGPFWL